MGNYCSSGQNKKEKDNVSEKSEGSPSYQLISKTKEQISKKEAPLADPEPTSDISNQTQALPSHPSTTARPVLSIKTFENIQAGAYISDSATNSPLALTSPCELPSSAHKLPPNLYSFYGKSNKNRRIFRDRKIVLYILEADGTDTTTEKSALQLIVDDLKRKCSARGFEFIIADAHDGLDSENNFLQVDKWLDGPLEAQGGHNLAANCIAEITRHSNTAYIIPLLFLGNSLGSPILPLTIENQDFVTALVAAQGTDSKSLLEKWYILDNTAQPQCYRLKTRNISHPAAAFIELEQLLLAMTELFTKELCDSYLTTVVEQEINNTIIISQELCKRCIWVQTGMVPVRLSDDASAVYVESNRRLNNIINDLRNKLPEKNLIRIPPSLQLPADQLGSILYTLIASNVDSIIEDHISKYQIPYCTYGVDGKVLEEIEIVNQHSKMLSQNCANIQIMDKIKNYVNHSCKQPLIIYGKEGSGKSVLTAKVAQHIHNWIPDCFLIMRYSNLTSLSTDFVAILGTIIEQLHFIAMNCAYTSGHTLKEYTNSLMVCSNKLTDKVIVFIDSLDDVNNFDNFDWIPNPLPDKLKIIITITSEATTADELIELKKWQSKCIDNYEYLHLNQFSDEQWSDVLLLGSGDFYASNQALQIPEHWKNGSEKNPLLAKIFWWLAWLGEYEIKNFDLNHVCERVFDVLEHRFGIDVTKFIISIIVASREGLTETDIVVLLQTSGLIKDSTSKLWIHFCWLMGPMLLHNINIRLLDNKLRTIAEKRYAREIESSYKLLQQYYEKQSDELTDQRGIFKCYNMKKLIELPYHSYKIDNQLFNVSPYLTDLTWIFNKLSASGCVHILNDISLLPNTVIQSSIHTRLLLDFLAANTKSLDYDSKQFYSKFQRYLQMQSQSDTLNHIVAEWIVNLQSIPMPYLELVNNDLVRHSNFQTKIVDPLTDKSNVAYDTIVNLGGDGYFVASLNTERGEICVWDVPRCKKVRTLNDIPQPTSICPVGNYMAAVLCRREIKIIDLNAGVFKVTLKGVMNQKMPYFGLHDAQHLVCLSRNRMYVNLMNIESGDCITTFKAGEDRFLNSLLVSGDGRILVCGDETQKPFPLLVWHLSQRKLLYDLRIPHHDFITSLSAITYEGSYVSVVAKELNEPTPNFIVVYDLQSGTLFKKWKPTCNTVSLAISQTHACVVAGLEDARILIWDLVTGNCKYTLIGHNAPVTLLKLDPNGKILLSADKDGRDLSIRLWELDTGKSLAVYTPPVKTSTCEILPNGKYIVIALEKSERLFTLQLKNYNILENEFDDSKTNECVYGNEEFEGKTFRLS